MWSHIQEIANVFQKITTEYGYDVFQDAKKSVSLINDLLPMYETERKVLRMLLLSGFGDVLPDEPYTSTEEARTDLHQINSFLKKLAIETEARESVVSVVEVAYGGSYVTGLGSFVNPVVTKNFDSCSFKITLPVPVDLTDSTRFSFRFSGAKTEKPVCVILDKCLVTDRVNTRFVSADDDHVVFKPGERNKTGEISIPHSGKKLFLSGAKVDLVFFCTDRKKIVVTYRFADRNSAGLSGIKTYKLTEKERQEAIEILDGFIAPPKPVGPPPPDGGPDNPPTPLPDIGNFSDALRHEIIFLRQGKGKRYKVVNGSKINKDNGIYTYSFELETELHLPDSAPITLDAGGVHAVGSVLSCEDFQIMLLIDRDLNDRVPVAFLMVEPWKLLEALDNKLKALNPNVNRLAVKLMQEGPDLATDRDIAGVPKGQGYVLRHLQKNDIVGVWGPPGTGKTYTMADIANKYLEVGKSVLIVSHSNVSVDGVIKQVVHLLQSRRDDSQEFLKEGRILRYGYVRDEELSKNPYATSFNYTLSKCPDYDRDLQKLTKKRDELKAKNQTKTPEYDRTEKEIKKIRESIRREERNFVQQAQLIGTTVSKVTVDSLFDERQFDLVMFDEVSMAYVPQVIVAAGLSKEKFMFVGDFKQLPPISQDPEAKAVLQVDIFTYLKIVDYRGNMFFHPWLVMLNEQRRMHPDIAEFPNKVVYKGLLTNHPDVVHARDAIVVKQPLPGDAINLINLSGTYCAASKNSDNSRFNILSAIVSFCTAVSAEKAGNKSVGVITPYAAQTRLIRAMIRDYYGDTDVVTCATVHQFQGSESDVLIFDAVESYPTNRVGFLMGKDLNQVLRLINVAITRARGKLITVANARFWENTFKGSQHIYYRLLQYIENGHKVINQKEKTLEPYIRAVDPMKMLWVFTDEKDAMRLFSVDMGRATGKVVVSIPDGRLNENQSKYLNLINGADNRGARILMKSCDYANLPAEWQKFCWGADNAVFPLIVIDDETAWFGLPTSRLGFKIDKSTTYNTVLSVMVRIQGRNTIEMLKALTDLEFIANGNDRRPLTEKASGQVAPTGGSAPSSSGKRRTSLAEFVEKKQFCPDCKSHMVLTKNRKGTAYLRCSNPDCDHMAYLDKDLINWYISSEDVQCPRMDGGELRGGVGKYGPYVRCSEGHFLKPEEI